MVITITKKQLIEALECISDDMLFTIHDTGEYGEVSISLDNEYQEEFPEFVNFIEKAKIVGNYLYKNGYPVTSFTFGE